MWNVCCLSSDVVGEQLAVVGSVHWDGHELGWKDGDVANSA